MNDSLRQSLSADHGMRSVAPATLPNAARMSSAGESEKKSYESERDPENFDVEKERVAKKEDAGDELPWYKQRKQSSAKDDPFGDEEDSDVKYKSMEWWQAAMIMIAETISLGILSLPSVLARVGMVPGIILIAGLGLLATYTGYTIGQFKMAHPHVRRE
jgi:hypothetical protein